MTRSHDDDLDLARRALEAGFLTQDTVQQALAACADGTRLATCCSRAAG